MNEDASEINNELNERSMLQKEIGDSFPKLLKFFVDNPNLMKSFMKNLYNEKKIDGESVDCVLSLKTDNDKADKLIETILLSKVSTMRDLLKFYENNLEKRESPEDDDKNVKPATENRIKPCLKTTNSLYYVDVSLVNKENDAAPPTIKKENLEYYSMVEEKNEKSSKFLVI